MMDLEQMQFRNEQMARRMKAGRFLQGVVDNPVPTEIKDEVIDDIYEIIAFAKNKKQARKQLRKLLCLWLD